MYESYYDKLQPYYSKNSFLHFADTLFLYSFITESGSTISGMQEEFDFGDFCKLVFYPYFFSIKKVN